MISDPDAPEQTEVAGRERSVLEVPADASSVKTSRLFAAAVARHFACAENEIEDVRLAVSEAVTSAIRGHQEAGVPAPIMISAELDGSVLRFEVASATAPAEPPLEGKTPPGGVYEGSLGLSIIESLFQDSAVAHTSDGGTLVTFSLSILAPLGDGS